MSEENLAMVVAADPQLAKNYIDRTREASWQIPSNYEREIGDILATPVSLLPSIETPEDYKTLVIALSVLKQCKQRVATIRHHLGGLNFRWSKLQKQATKFIETKYYTQLNNVRADTKKSVVVNALEPISSGVEELEHLVDNADRCLKHLSDLNWAVTNSGELVVQYFNAIKVFVPREI